MLTTLLLWDIDGTLLKTNGMGMQAMRDVAASLFGEHWTWDGVVASGGLDPLIFAEAAAINRLDDVATNHERFREQYLQRLQRVLVEKHDNVQIMPGVTEAVDHFRGRADDPGDVTLGMLTGNYSRAVPMKLAAINMDPAWFTITAFGDEAPTRPDLTALAMRKYHQRTGHAANPRRVIVIGDTVRDVHCAHAHGCVAFGVATGGSTVAELREAGAEVVVEDLADMRPLIELVDHCAQGLA